jgi:8-oxo-dGTP pyrophosphatase MutT (NUDIX family)
MPHIHDAIDFTCEVFIVYNNRVLLRKHDKYKLWLSVGGHIELDEDPNAAAKREVKEEVGLDIELYKDSEVPFFIDDNYKELIPPQFLNIHRINDTHKHIALTYFGKSLTDKLSLSETELSDGCKWFNSEELDDPKYQIKEHIKYYAKKALEKLSL